MLCTFPVPNGFFDDDPIIIWSYDKNRSKIITNLNNDTWEGETTFNCKEFSKYLYFTTTKLSDARLYYCTIIFPSLSNRTFGYMMVYNLIGTQLKGNIMINQQLQWCLS